MQCTTRTETHLKAPPCTKGEKWVIIVLANRSESCCYGGVVSVAGGGVVLAPRSRFALNRTLQFENIILWEKLQDKL